MACLLTNSTQSGGGGGGGDDNENRVGGAEPLDSLHTFTTE